MNSKGEDKRRQLDEERQALLDQHRHEREQTKRFRNGEMPAAGHGSERLAFHNARVASSGKRPAAPVQTTNTSSQMSSAPMSESPLPPSLRMEKLEFSGPGLGEKIYRVA